MFVRETLSSSIITGKIFTSTLNTRHFSSPLYGIIKGRRSPDSKESETEAKQQDEENHDGGY